MARPRKSPAEQKAAEPHPQELQQEQPDQQAPQKQAPPVQAQELQQEPQDQQAPQKQAPPVQAQGPVPTDPAGADAPAMAAVPVAVQDPELEPEPEPLEAFLRRVERLHIARDVVATAATHPHATQRVWPGTYGGIRLEVGPLSVTYSDGSTA